MLKWTLYLQRLVTIVVKARELHLSAQKSISIEQPEQPLKNATLNSKRGVSIGVNQFEAGVLEPMSNC